MRPREGNTPRIIFFTSGQPIVVLNSLGWGGINLGLNQESNIIKVIKIRICAIDGPIAPRYISPTDLPN